MKRIFGDLKMSWPIVLVFAVVAGLITGILGSIPATEGTSFRDIAISHEWWVIFAFAIASNSQKNWESALKIFVFFLISQPVVFAIEVLLGQVTADMAIYYYTSIWGPATLATLPGGFLAFYIKKQNPFGWIILGLGNTIQAVYGVHYLASAITTPPFHILTAIVCFASIFIMAFQIQQDRKGRVATLSITAGITLLLAVLLIVSGRTLI